jgi:hypothetical protein
MNNFQYSKGNVFKKHQYKNLDSFNSDLLSTATRKND